MRTDHPLLMLLVNKNYLSIKEAKRILTFPLISIPDASLHADAKGKIVSSNLDDPWSKFALAAQSRPRTGVLNEHPLSIYSVITSASFYTNGKKTTVINHYYVETLDGGRSKIRATVFTDDSTGKLTSTIFEEKDLQVITPGFDKDKMVYCSYIAIKEMLGLWFDYISSIKLTPVLRQVSSKVMGKKANIDLQLKSSTQSSLIFLDRLPTRYESVNDVERLCTESTSKRGHQRIAYRKTLTADRYRNHPKYMVKDGVRVRTTWVGERTSTDLEGNTYTVMELK